MDKRDSHRPRDRHYRHRQNREKESQRRSRSREPKPLKGRGVKSSGLRAWDTDLFPQAKVTRAEPVQDKPWVEVAMKELEDKGYSVSETATAKVKVKEDSWRHDKFSLVSHSPNREDIERASPTRD